MDSEVSASGGFSVEIDSPGSDQSLHEEPVQLPFEQEFSIAMDSALPLRNTRVVVDAGPGAAYIECRIIVNGEVVATHRAGGGGERCNGGVRTSPSAPR